MSAIEHRETPILLTVTGMSCAGCVRTVETALNVVPGVASASVNFASQTAMVEGAASLETLVGAVHQAGYEATEFRNTSVEVQDQEARLALTRSATRSAVALAGGAFLMADMMLGVMPGLENKLVWSVTGLLVLLVMMFAGGHFYRAAVTALRNGTATMDTLVSLGTGSAWLYSMLIVLAPELVPAESRHQFFEAALFIIGFVNLGKALEANARTRATLAVRKLFDLAPRFVSRIREGGEEKVPLDFVEPGDRLRVRPGESVPVDGVIVEGESQIDESMLTGESEPITRTGHDMVRAGTLNLDGSLVVKAERVGSDTLLGSMIRLVSEAQNSKPPVARLVDQISAIFVPIVIIFAVVTALAWWNFGPEPALSYTLVTSMSVLIIACPCALGLAVPMSIMIGLGRAAGDGLLIRNSDVLQSATSLTTVVMDKTGTLTLGEPMVVESSVSEGSLAVAVALESHSEHPLARAIVESGGDVDGPTVEDFVSHTGGGVSAIMNGHQVLIGSERFLVSKGIEDIPDAGSEGTTVFLAEGEKVTGWFRLEDGIRLDAREIVSGLQNRGIKVVMLSGDRPEVVRKVAAEVGISEAHGGLLPEDKLDLIRQYQGQGEVVGMVGDGINDAAALAAADVGFAMGGGTDIAKESADVTLLGQSLAGVLRSVSLSRAILENIRQNLVAAFAYNLVLIPVAAGILFPFTGMLINPALAGLAMAASSVSVVFNAGRLRLA